MNDLPSDGTLIAAVLAGEKDRFVEIVARYEVALVRLATSKVGRRDWAQEVVQETFLCAYKSLASYRSEYSFRTWLWAILLNQCKRHSRRMARTPRVANWSDGPVVDGAIPVPETDVAAGPMERAAAAERNEFVERLLKQLPDVQADALRLRFYGRLKFQEIADTLECSLSGAKTRVRNGLIRMSEMMVEAGWNSDILTRRVE